jgi:DNA-binding SARP family transcriptional activator
LGTDEKFIARSGDIYRVQPDLFDVDVWEFERLLDEADRDTNRPAELLRVAGDLYRGALVEGAYYDWAEPLGSHFHRRFVDAMVRLAEINCEEGRKEDAVDVLERTITVEPFGEYIYRRAMTLYADLGRRNEIWRLYRRARGGELIRSIGLPKWSPELVTTRAKAYRTD